MSSISSGVDITVKYQRLTSEFVKVRNQISVLKSAMLEEQSKNAERRRELQLRDTALSKLESERDSLLFRNEQLVKRVESLQESVDAQQATFGAAKSKKKHKEANLRLVAETSRMHQQALGGSSQSDPLAVMEEELERKITENGELHSKLLDVEKRFDEATREYLNRIDKLERENAALRKGGASSTMDRMGTNAKQKDRLRAGSISNGLAKVTTSAVDEETVIPSETTLNFQLDGSPAPARNDLLSCAELNNFPFSGSHSQSSGGKPSDSAISLDSGEQTETAGADAEGSNNSVTVDRKLLEDYQSERISTLNKSLQHATGRATYYKQECEELIRKGMFDQEQMNALRAQIADMEAKCDALNDTLETTQTNYETQIRDLYEHMAGQDTKIVAQADQRAAKLFRGTDTNRESPVTETAERSTENGAGKSKSDRTPRTWFSSSSSASK